MNITIIVYLIFILLLAGSFIANIIQLNLNKNKDKVIDELTRENTGLKLEQKQIENNNMIKRVVDKMTPNELLEDYEKTIGG